MSTKKKIFLTVTNDLNYDQRMIRICTTLHNAGYDVTLIGWQWSTSQALIDRPFTQVRLPLPMRQGKLMYFLYWLRLFIYLLPRKADAYCAIDLDTILPIFLLSTLKNTKRVYDAHEIFTEMQEVNKRPIIKKIWEWIGNTTIPQFPIGYTIGESYATFFKKKYGVSYETVRNATVLKPLTVPNKDEKYILYQGAVNVGRCFEQLIPAMQMVDSKLIIIGKGNFSSEVERMVKEYKLEDKVLLLGYKRPEALKLYTEKAWIGITLFDESNDGMSNLFSMANRFFDYMHHGVPQLCNAFPEYIKVNESYPLAILLDDTNPESIAKALNELLDNDELHAKLSAGAIKARTVYNWQEEEKKLLALYHKLFNT